MTVGITARRLAQVGMLLGAYLALGIAGCGSENGPRNVVVALFDTSQSTGVSTAAASYRQGFKQIAEYFREGAGGLVVADAISSNSLGESSPVSVSFPHKGATTNPLTFAASIGPAIESAEEGANAVIAGPRHARGTTILDALQNAHDYFRANPDAHQYLVIFSDMIEESGRLTFTKAVLGRNGADRWVASHRDELPDLAGVSVYVAGAGVSKGGSDPEKISQIRAFWTKVFDATGADLVSYRATLFQFP